MGEKKVVEQEEKVEGVLNKKPKEEIVYAQKHKKANKEDQLFDNQMIIQFSMLEIKAPSKVEEIEKTIMAIQKKRVLKQKLYEDEVRKLESKKDQILSGERKEAKKQVLDEESFPSL